MRDHFWDQWKGIAIMAVVTIHGIGSAFEGAPNLAGLDFHIALFIRQALNFAVPLFLGVAGYFSVKSVNTLAEYSSYLGSRLLRLIPAYVFWTLIYVTIRRENPFASGEAIVRTFFLGSGISIGYYVIVLVQYICIAPLLLAIQRKRVHLVVMALGFLVGSLYSYVIRLGFPASPLADFPLNGILFFVWYPFFHLGLYLKKFNPKLPNLWWRRLLLASCLFFFGLSFLEAEFLVPYSLSVAISQLKATGFIATGLLLLCLKFYSDQSRARFRIFPFAFAGSVSYFVYLSHLLVMSPIRRFANQLMVLQENQWLEITVVISVTIAVCLTLAWTFKATLPVRIQRLIGI